MTVKSTTPIAGFDPEAIFVRGVNFTQQSPFEAGTAIIADDGRKYVYGRASAAIPASTEIEFTEPEFTAAAGGGGFTSPASDMEPDNFAWFRQNEL